MKTYKRTLGVLVGGIFCVLFVGDSVLAGPTNFPTADSFTVNGGSTATVVQSGSVTFVVTATATNGSNGVWKSTAWRIGSSGAYTCVNTADVTNPGTATASFIATAPATIGTYDASVEVYNNDTCSSGASGVSTLTNAITVVAPDTTAPSVTAASIHSSNTTPSKAKVGDIVTLTFTASEPVRTPVVTIATHSVTAATTTGNSFSTTYTLVSGDTEGAVPFSITLTDLAGNPASAVTTPTDGTSVLFDKTRPVIAAHATVTVEATGPTGATVTYTAPTATDTMDGPVSVSCLPASGSTFALGNTTITCGAGDSTGNTSTNTFTVSVVDTTRPVIAPHGPENAPATGASTVVSYTLPTATDEVDGTVPVTCAPASGSGFPVGNTNVQCSATDSHGNAAVQTSFTVTVTDASAPTMGTHADMTVASVGNTGAVVTFDSPTATDNVDGTLPVTCAPASGSTFTLGNTTVDCQATDSSSNTAHSTFVVHVTDQTEPTLTVPADITANATSANGAAVSFTASATDAVDGTVTPVCDYASGTTFSTGDTTVHCTATDAAKNATSSSFMIRVVDVAASQTGTASVRSTATPGGDFAGGWQWVFHYTLPFGESLFTMLFSDLASGANTVPVANNLRFFSPQASLNADEAHAITITAANATSTAMLFDADANSETAGRQVDVTVQMRVPAGTPDGSYIGTYSAESTSPIIPS